MRNASKLSLILIVLSVAAFAQTAATPSQDAQPGVLPLTTKSPEVRQMMNDVWRYNLDEVEQAKAIEVLQRVVKIDPDFAMGHELLSQTSLDPLEQVSEQKKASATKANASEAERMVISWLQDAADHKTITAITEMNQVLSEYPRDRWVVFLATWWLMQQTQYDRAVAVFENSGITNSAGLNNNMGYVYAYMRRYDKAFALMDKYVQEMPDVSNPQDSYAEILRMAGRFDQSIDHYRASLAINPQFYSSQFGIADTYSLMGDQTRARREYEMGFQKFSIPVMHQVQWKTREAATYVREGDYEGANKLFQAIANLAHEKHLSQVEADTYRQMAMYQPNPKDAVAYLDKADQANAAKNAWEAATAQETAQILRARVEAAIELKNKKMMNSALDQLGNMSQKANDKVIDTAYHAAQGAALFYQRKYKDAISHLEEDPNNPLSLKLLAQAYEKTGDEAGAKQINESLMDFNDPTLEQAMVVPAFRKCYHEGGCAEKAASLK